MKKWQVLSRAVVFDKYGRRVEKVRFKLPNGKEGDFYIKNEKSPVCVLALTKNKKVILVKQYRPGPDKILCELPGGGIDGKEKPMEAIKRELLEEIGYQGKIKLVTRCYESAYCTVNRYCFVATDCVKVAPQKLDETEFGEVVLLSLREFKKMLRSGKMTDVDVGYLGLDYLGLL